MQTADPQRSATPGSVLIVELEVERWSADTIRRCDLRPTVFWWFAGTGWLLNRYLPPEQIGVEACEFPRPGCCNRHRTHRHLWPTHATILARKAALCTNSAR